MTHLDEGTILELRDGALVSADTRIHVEACSTCAESLSRATRRGSVIAESLSVLDVPMDVGRAKADVRARLDASRAAERPKRGGQLPLGRAAALVLFAAGAAWALPGSPLRDWISATDPTGATAPASTETIVGQSVEGEGIEVEMPAGGIVISLSTADAGSEVRVVWVDQPVARISAAPGSTYGFAEGRAEANVAPGPVTIEVDRSASRLTIEIDGLVVFEGTPLEPRVGDVAASSTADGLVFPAAAR